MLQACAAARLCHYQRSVAFRLCYCLCLLPCSKCHSDVIIIFFLKLECHQCDILVRLILLLHTRRTEFQSASSVTALNCLFWNFIYSSFLVLLLHISLSAPSFSFFLPPCQEVPFKHLCVFPRRHCKTGVFLQSVFCLCI